MSGAVETILVCRTAIDSVTVSPCPSSQAPVAVSAYVLDVTAQSSIEAGLSPVDFAESSQFWGLSFLLVLSLWSLAYMLRQGSRAIR